MADTITGIQYDTSGTATCIQGKDSLNSNVQGRNEVGGLGGKGFEAGAGLLSIGSGFSYGIEAAHTVAARRSQRPSATNVADARCHSRRHLPTGDGRRGPDYDSQQEAGHHDEG